MEHTSVILIGFLPNPRIYKRIDLEKQLGQVHLICWDRGESMLQTPSEDGYKAHVIRLNASLNPLKRLLPYRKFRRKASKLLNELQPDLIHVQGLDMLKIACEYKKSATKPVKIIYEVADLHRLLVDQQTSLIRMLAQQYLRYTEHHLESQYELLVLTSMKYYDVYFSSFVDQKKILYMANVPNLSTFRAYKKKNSGAFTIGYLGSIRYMQQLINLIEVAKKEGDHLLFAGFEGHKSIIEPLCHNNPNIEWIGRFDFAKQAAELYGKCDVIYSVYDADMHNVRVALPNKLYEAVYCELPIIVAKNTYLAQIVEQWGVGVAVDHKSVDELEDALNELRENTVLREQIAENCRKHKAELDLAIYNEALKEKISQLLGEQ